MKKALLVILVTIVPTAALAAHVNTAGYVAVSELKAWDDHIDIYFEDGQQHTCSGDQKGRFLLDPSREAHYRLLLSAFLSGRPVSLRYNCEADNYPWVTGVRVR